MTEESKTHSILWIGLVEHEHGTNIYASRTEEGVRRQTWEYVAEWWDSEVGGPVQ